MLNKDYNIGATTVNISKAFETLNQNNLLCEPKVYRFNTKALTFMQSYFQIKTKEQK